LEGEYNRQQITSNYKNNKQKGTEGVTINYAKKKILKQKKKPKTII
jgi:hypothetical protein